MKKLNTIPKKDGFRMPGEFEKHSGTYIIWPERPDNWRLGAKPAQHVFTRVANAIGKYEPITMVVLSALSPLLTFTTAKSLSTLCGNIKQKGGSILTLPC